MHSPPRGIFIIHHPHLIREAQRRGVNQPVAAHRLRHGDPAFQRSGDRLVLERADRDGHPAGAQIGVRIQFIGGTALDRRVLDVHRVGD